MPSERTEPPFDSMSVDEALALSDDYGWDGHNFTPTGSDEWDMTLEALCVLAASVRRIRVVMEAFSDAT